MYEGQYYEDNLTLSSARSNSVILLILTFLHVWTTTRETSPSFKRCSIPNRSGTDGSILVQKMRVLCAAAFAEILDLHNFGKRGDVSIGLGSFGIIVSFEDFLILRDAINGVKSRMTTTTHLAKSTFVPVFLKEPLLTFWLLFARFLRLFQILFESLFFRQSSSALNLFSLLLHANLFLLFLFNAAEFPHPPGLEFSLRIQTIRVINIWDSFLLLLYNSQVYGKSR